MKIIDLQRILYPMSICLKTVRDDYFYFGYYSDLAISIQKISDEKWELNTYERDKLTNQKLCSNEYIGCLKFLYHLDKISNDDPNVMKLIDYSDYWELFEKNNYFYYKIHSLKPYIYRTFSIILSNEELEKYRSQGRNFLNLLQIEIDSSIPTRKSSDYHNRELNEELETELYYTSLEEHELRFNDEDYSNVKDNHVVSKNHTPPIWQEPQKNGTKIVILLVGLIIIFYIIFFSVFEYL